MYIKISVTVLDFKFLTIPAFPSFRLRWIEYQKCILKILDPFRTHMSFSWRLELGDLLGKLCGQINFRYLSHDAFYLQLVLSETQGISNKKLIKTCQHFIWKDSTHRGIKRIGENIMHKAQSAGTEPSRDVPPCGHRRETAWANTHTMQGGWI